MQKVLIVGAGAIGACMAAWLKESGVDVAVIDLPESMAAMESRGLTIYQVHSAPATRRATHVPTVMSLERFSRVDILVFAVKNFALPQIATDVHRRFMANQRDEPIVVSLANGVLNQTILPTLFKRVVYGVVCFNVRRDTATSFAYGTKGPLLIGTPTNELQDELHQVFKLFSTVCPTHIVNRLGDAVHTKIVLNLLNALEALVGRGATPMTDVDAYVKLVAHVLWEGACIVRAAGYREYRIPDIPAFRIMHLATLLPAFVLRPILQRKLLAVPMLSMTQDVMFGNAALTELDSITGYILELADKHGISAPFNRTVYALGIEHFHKGFRPITCTQVLEAVRQRIAADPRR